MMPTIDNLKTNPRSLLEGTVRYIQNKLKGAPTISDGDRIPFVKIVLLYEQDEYGKEMEHRVEDQVATSIINAQQERIAFNMLNFIKKRLYFLAKTKFEVDKPSTGSSQSFEGDSVNILPSSSDHSVPTQIIDTFNKIRARLSLRPSDRSRADGKEEKEEHILFNQHIEKYIPHDVRGRIAFARQLRQEIALIRLHIPHQQELLKVVGGCRTIQELQTIYASISSSETINEMGLSDYLGKEYTDCVGLVHKVCVIRSLELIREQFMNPESQLSTRVQSLSLSDQEIKDRFSKFFVEYKSPPDRESHLPVAPFYLQVTSDTQYIDLCAFLKISFRFEGITDQHITNDSDWDRVISQLIQCPLEAFNVEMPNNQPASLLMPRHIQMISKEALDNFDSLCQDSSPTSLIHYRPS